MTKKIFITLLFFFCITANAVEKKTNFSIETLEKAKASGKTIVINSYEVWCGTCSKQTKILNQAKKEFSDVIFLSYEQSKNKDIVLLSRQIATLFTANVSAVRVFAMLAAEVENTELSAVLTEVVTDMEAGSPLSKALSKHPRIFSQFYVNMVASGEETGKLSQTFEYLAEYLERN